MSKARKTPTKGSFKVNFDENGRVKTFEIKGKAANAFYEGLMKACDEREKKAKEKKPCTTQDGSSTSK
jgi:hypothetical protein